MVFCPYCQCQARLTDSKEIYGKSYGNIYVCDLCNAYVGCHKGTDRPLGRLANKKLRKLRSRCHELFDPMWKDCSMSRTEAYEWLRNILGLSKKVCHIAKFDETICERMIRLLEEV